MAIENVQYSAILLEKLELELIGFLSRLVAKVREFPGRKIRILSLGCGTAREEELLLHDIDPERVVISLVDINESLLEKAKERLSGQFAVHSFIGDLNELELEEEKYDIVMCVSALHHVIELEHLIDNIVRSLIPGGEFWSIGEYIGRNGTRLYDDAYAVANDFFRTLPERYRMNRNPGNENLVDELLPNQDCSLTCFEGIRSENILALLKQKMTLVESLEFDCFLWRLFNSAYLLNYNADNSEDMAWVEKAIALEVDHFNGGGRATAFHGVFIKEGKGGFVSSVKNIFRRALHRPLKKDVQFQCNICANQTSSPVERLSREVASCHVCGSTVRMRAIVHVLSMELFGDSLTLPDFPKRKDLRGIGMSDWDGYAKPLEKLFDYTSTYYHQEPRLDITDIDEDLVGSLDFVISSDVFEHVLFPVDRAFTNTRRLLKDIGVFVFTVPYAKEGEKTVEHFGQLHEFEIYQKDGGYVLKDVDSQGAVREFDDLVFHGGPGSTLEMRVFNEKSLMREFAIAGFSNVKVYGEPYIKYGIYWGEDTWSLPIAARVV